MSVFVGEGDLYEIRNYRTNRASFFEYDHAGRCMASTERAFTVSNGVIHYGAALSSYRYEYDVCNNLTKLTCSVAGTTWNTTYTYDADNRPKTTTTWSGTVLTNTYDSLGRLTKRTWGFSSAYETRLEYWLNGDNRTTLLHRYYNGSDDPFVYSYDDNGNITSITQGSTGITYEYDEANRLTRENNRVTNETVTYEYDDFGNILNKKIYAYTTGTLPATPVSTVGYTYASSGWTDRLTSYNGQTITYDAMGNPLTYRGYTFTWQGKQLMSSVNGSQQITFEYNEDGLRQRKTVNGTDTDYFYNGSVLIGMQRGQSKFLFSYDASGNVVSVKYNNNEYYYVRNGQGDIVKLIDSTGTTVVEYIYNTWGKKVTTTGSLAGSLGLIQPFRYRGYVYDYETGFYYLQSRYYDPTTGRFISADVLLSTGQGVLGHNAYAYCGDNPLSRKDSNGAFWEEILEWLKRFFDGGNSSNDTSPAPALTATPLPTVSPVESLIEERINYALENYVGTPYKTMKCSNLVDKMFGDLINSKRVLAASQWDAVNNSTDWIVNRYVSEADLKYGDLLFYTDPSCTCGKRTDEIHHVSVYLNNGMMLDSTQSKMYKIDGVSVRPITSILINETTGVQYEIFGYARYIGNEK